jgi:hypothetical protein
MQIISGFPRIARRSNAKPAIQPKRAASLTTLTGPSKSFPVWRDEQMAVISQPAPARPELTHAE